MKKLIVSIDGEKLDPVVCSSINIQFEGDTVIVNGSTENVPEEDTPTEDGVALPVHTSAESFLLQGDDLEAFKILSEFRREEFTMNKEDAEKPTAVVLESGVYNIQDQTAVQSASLDLVEQERKYVDDGYMVISTEIPKYEYETDFDFKLVESVVLSKVDKEPSTDEKKTT